ncbi:MAG: alpha/beta fold hydrolase [Bradyrhizobium sp.]
MNAKSTPVVFIPALLCDEALYSGVIAGLGSQIEAHVMMSPKPRLEDSVVDILARAPATFALVGTSYGGILAIEIALAAPERVTALWLMGCDPDGPKAGGPDLAGGLETTPDAVIGMLAGLVVHKDAADAAATFKTMAKRIGGTAGAAQARALNTRKEATSRLGKSKMSTLVLWGNDDALVPVAVGQALADHLPRAHFKAFENCGHLPTLERPAESAALFAELLRDENQQAV